MIIRELIGEEKIARFFNPESRYINPKLKIYVDDGVYDNVHSKSRVVIINNWVMYIMSDMWLQKGGPSDLDSLITSPPFGHFRDYEESK